jgi:hypothetical protein
MKAIEVTARWLADGKVMPSQVSTDQGTFAVEAVGRQWTAEDGLHILVKLPADQTWELIFALEQLRWFVAGSWAPASMV